MKGGTGWTVQLAMDQGKPVYLFVIPSQSWYRSDHYYQVDENATTLVTGSQFVPWGPKGPALHQSSAIVGSRDLDSPTRAEIQALFNRTFCLPENMDQLRLKTFICNFQLYIAFFFLVFVFQCFVFIFQTVHSFSNFFLSFYFSNFKFSIVNRSTPPAWQEMDTDNHL